MTRPVLIKGSDLDTAQREEVMESEIFKGRFTSENRDADPFDQRPNIPGEYVQSDESWLNSHAFYFLPNGHLAKKPAYAEPLYMADYQRKRSYRPSVFKLFRG